VGEGAFCAWVGWLCLKGQRIGGWGEAGWGNRGVKKQVFSREGDFMGVGGQTAPGWKKWSKNWGGGTISLWHGRSGGVMEPVK